MVVLKVLFLVDKLLVLFAPDECFHIFRYLSGLLLERDSLSDCAFT